MREAGIGGLVHSSVRSSVRRTPPGVLLGLASAASALALAAVAITRPRLLTAPDRALPLRRPQCGHVGDYVPRLLAGTTLPAALALPGGLRELISFRTRHAPP